MTEYSKKFVYKCAETNEDTGNLRIALEWHKAGKSVDFWFDGENVGKLSYAGHFQSEDCLPYDGDYGTVYSAVDKDGKKSLYIAHPED